MKITHLTNHTRILATGTVLLTGFSAANAAIVQSTDSTNNAYTVSSTDLLQGIVPINSGSGTLGSVDPNDAFSTANPAVLTNGIFGSANANQDQPPKQSTLAVGNNVILDFTLATVEAGFTVQTVTSYGGWQDGGRNANRFTLLYSTVAAPATFLSLATVNFDPADRNSRVIISDDGAVPLASGVGVLRFDFGTNQENTYAGYREFDVTGVPEPTTLSLLGLGALGLAARRRRA